jgi:hypothetical protein
MHGRLEKTDVRRADPCDRRAVLDRRSELRGLLNEWDFIGVFEPITNTDEYDCMIAPLLTRLAAGAESDDIEHFLDEEITGHFGMSPGLVDTRPIAERLTAWWRAPDDSQAAEGS